ncbi:MAG TPA: glycosyltransferase family 2 protein [Chthoniobacterales bacterium]
MVAINGTVTVLIPTYNRADYLRETILSVLSQTWSAVDVLVLDDASTDETPAVVGSFAENPRVRGIRHEKNVGMAGNWKAGVAAVRGDFFILLNDDDLLEPEFVESLVQPLLANPDLILAFCDHNVIDGKGRLLAEMTRELSERHHRTELATGVLTDFGTAAVLHRSLHISCTLFRTAMTPADFLDEQAGGFACGWLFYQCYRTGYGAWYVNRRLSNYRVHPGNMLQNHRWENYLANGQIYWLHRMLADDLPEPLASRVRTQVADIFSSYAAAWLTTGERVRAAALFAESFALRKNAKALGGLFLCRLGSTGTSLMPLLRRFKREHVRAVGHA